MCAHNGAGLGNTYLITFPELAIILILSNANGKIANLFSQQTRHSFLVSRLRILAQVPSCVPSVVELHPEGQYGRTPRPGTYGSPF